MSKFLAKYFDNYIKIGPFVFWGECHGMQWAVEVYLKSGKFYLKLPFRCKWNRFACFFQKTGQNYYDRRIFWGKGRHDH